jgi:hypothetical protein
MRLYLLFLIPMVVITFIAVVLGEDFISVSINANLQQYSGDVFNASQYDWMKDDYASGSIGIDSVAGAIAIIVVVATVGALIGIQFLGSGLSDSSARILMMAIAYVGVWAMLSILVSPLLLDIAVFGSIIYIGLTLGYAIGVLQMMFAGE